MRFLIPTTLTLLWLAVPASASTPTVSLGCGAGKLVLSVHYTVLNDVDTGLKGNNWAFDSYLRTVKVWRKAAGKFCAASVYSGNFTSNAGWSPAGKVQIPAGIRGTFRGSSVTTFRGAFAPGDARVGGDLGTKDFECTSDDKKGDCAGTFDWLTTYFTATTSFRYLKYAFTYHATQGGKGTWQDILAGGKIHTTGDIRPLKKS